jgi:hypothetical protein
MGTLYGTDISDAVWALIEPHRQCRADGDVVAQSSTCLSQGASGGCCRVSFCPRAPSTTPTASDGDGACGCGYSGRCTSSASAAHADLYRLPIKQYVEHAGCRGPALTGDSCAQEKSRTLPLSTGEPCRRFARAARACFVDGALGMQSRR